MAGGVVDADGSVQLTVLRSQNAEMIVDLTTYGYVVAEVKRRGSRRFIWMMAG